MMWTKACETAPFRARPVPMPISYYHEPELVVEAVCQHPAQVVLDDGEEDGEHRHRRPDRHQDVDAGEAAGEAVDRELGGEGAEDDGAGYRGLGVGVLQPVVQQREGALDAEGEEDQGAAEVVEPRVAEVVEGERPGGVVTDQKAGQQQHAGADLDEEVAHAGAEGALAAAGPDQEDRSYRGELPVNEEGEQVAGENGAHGGADVHGPAGVLQAVPEVEGVDRRDDGGHAEDVSEGEAELVDAGDGEAVVEEGELSGRSRFEGEQVGAAEDRQGEQPELLQPSPQHREQRRPEDHDRPGSEVPPGSRDRRERRQGRHGQQELDGPAHRDGSSPEDESSPEVETSLPPVSPDESWS